MTDPARRVPPTLPVPILKTLGDFENAFGVTLRLMLSPVEPGGADQAW